MSRFGLRSASDVLKQSEERPNRRKSSSLHQVSLSVKQSLQVKESKFLTNLNEESIIDDIKIEIEDVERAPDITEGLPRRKSLNGEEEDEDEEDDEECVQRALPFVGGLICSLPLDRLSGVIQKLNLTKSKFNKSSNQKQCIEKISDDVDESVDNDDDEEDELNTSKHSTTTTKNLCLYCDKKFSSHKMQLKHVEKFHCLQQDRRCSGRKIQLQQTQSQKKKKPATGSQNFPGCTFCQNNKCLSQSIILPSSELSALFVHLADCHPDKYFGCKACVLRFQNISNLSKHMEVIHKSLTFSIDENSCKSRDNDNETLLSIEKAAVNEKSKCVLKRQQRAQKNLSSSIPHSSGSFVQGLPITQCTSALAPNTSIIGAEEPILSRLGLTQNRLPNNRKGMRLRREKLLPELLLKSEQNNQSSNNFAGSLPPSSSVPSVISPKLRGKAVKAVAGDALPEVIFRVPTRSDFLSCVFDDNFYKEVVSNVRNNLLFHLDGKIMGSSPQTLNNAILRHVPQPHIRSTLVKSPIVVTSMDSEIHAATSLEAVTAFPTLLTASQFGGEGSSSKLRRPHTKNSWKWKWDSVKKFKLVNEGGKIVKKMKHPIFGLRDLSKLDMWTQLTMRKKREVQHFCFNDDKMFSDISSEILSDPSREEKQRLNDQLNLILDMRLLPHIILEQNEQAIIKLENDEFGIAPFQEFPEDIGENFMAQTFDDENFLSLLNLHPSMGEHKTRTRLVLSGEWARPRCYLCMCCGAKFEKQKSLEEHKMFRHSQILSTHYEVVGRDLLNGNLLRHLFLPKKALSRYANEMGSYQLYSGAARRLFWHKNEALAREITNNEESSDSLQSMLNSCVTNSPSVKNSSSTEDCDIESKIATTTDLDLIPSSSVVSPTHSIQSCSSLSSTGQKSNSKMLSSVQPLSNIANANSCSKCGRKCSGILDLYRHMLDCSGDYVWSLAKKRKYRYYCGSKKRRPCNKHSILELRKNKIKQPLKVSQNITEITDDGCATTSGNFQKAKTSPRPRPSDAESIKKMLENLPPKRVCKKIFPTLSKAKKNNQNIKPKLLAKHKIYNSLRKTRVRQMSQAAKILSKTKSKLKKSMKMTTRSSAAPLASKINNKANNNKNKLQMFLKKNENSQGSMVKTPSPSPSSRVLEQTNLEKDEMLSSVKVELEKEQEPLLVEKSISLSEDLTQETSDKHTPGTVSVNSMTLSSSMDKQDELTANTTITQTFDTSLAPPLITPVESSIKSITSDVVNQGCAASQQATSTCIIIPSSYDSNTNIPNNKNIKRSKRISDCIAMLTGKLEQKLKTEKNVSELVPSEKPVVNTTAHLSLNQPVIPVTQLQSLVPPPKEVLPEAEDCKVAASKKNPKRKTISRRILKTDGEEVSGTHPIPAEPQVNMAYNSLANSSEPQVNMVYNSLANSAEAQVNMAYNSLANSTEPQVNMGYNSLAKSAEPQVNMGYNSLANSAEPQVNMAYNSLANSAEPEVNMAYNSLVNSGKTPVVVQSTFSVAEKHAEVSVIKENLSTKSNMPKIINTKASVEKLKLMPEHIFAHVDSNQVKAIPTTLIPAPIPPVLPLNNKTLISKVPLFLPMENLRPPHVGQLPLPLPMAVSAPAPQPQIQLENITQLPAERHTPGGATAGIHLMPPTALPMISAVPPAHLPPPSNITMPVTSFSIPATAEPLNLSNSSKHIQKQSQDLSCSNRQRFSGIPARRQTICGFEARNFEMFDEMEPLDLSKKARPEKSMPIVRPLPPPIEMPSVLLPVQNPVTLSLPTNMSVDNNLLPALPLPAEALLNKSFYSNLDLLRIPQVRNPTGPQTITMVESTPPLPSPNAAIVNSCAVGAVTIKPSAKKRNKSNNMLTNTTCIESVSCTPCNTSMKMNYSKEINSSKKESSAKSKPILRMDEEVINHIDDAINSVINAVKASLDSEEAEMSINLLPKATDIVTLPNESSGDLKRLTASRRNVRSKTLDCRPAVLHKPYLDTPQLPTIAAAPNYNISSSVNPIITVKNIEELKEFNQCSYPQQIIATPTEPGNVLLPVLDSEKEVLESSAEISTVTLVENSHELPLNNENNILDDTKDLYQNDTMQNASTVSTNALISESNALISESDALISESDALISETNALISPENDGPILDTEVESTNIPVENPVPHTEETVAVTTPTNKSNLDVEQMSNNNNTSSGFHSSAQSDQQASVMSTNTSISVPGSGSVIVCDTKKTTKQRRRRKNELAAIVADQLLESFKLDKARRDNLKKLENLAYEKSEDLLLTGMLLMSSTKRNVNSASITNATATTVGTTTTATSATDSTVEIVGNSKRTNKIQQNTEEKFNNSTAVECDKSPLESVEANDGKRNYKRKQYRRRGKVIDNENISKLKSSLESFSIDIERQLTEYEAKNFNVFKNVPQNDTEKVTANNTAQTAANLKPSVILRPSILSMTLEANVTCENTSAAKVSVSADTNKTIVSSRDPRLNKNIHKEGEKISEFPAEERPCVIQQKPQPGPAEIGDIEEDNYLTEIAKNVNEKIMSTENEEFAFKDDGFEMANDAGADDSNSKFSRPPTSMSVRSAPNFNDDRSNFGSICDDNTNTEVMDMDLDDEMSVYTSYSQDLGRGRGRRRRRRRSILLTRKPKKRVSCRDPSEKIECILCKKVFYSPNSLSKHNMTLAHVSKVSEQEYLMSKSMQSTVEQVQPYGSLGPYARRCNTRRATISEPPSHMQSFLDNNSLQSLPLPEHNSEMPNTPQSPPSSTQNGCKAILSPEVEDSKKEEELPQPSVVEQPKSPNTPNLQKEVQDSEVEENVCTAINSTYNGNSRLDLNPDERLFFECCNILKSAETPRINNIIVSEECENLNTNYASYSYNQQNLRERPNVDMENAALKTTNLHVDRQLSTNVNQNQQSSVEQTAHFRDPQYINVTNCYNKSALEQRLVRSPTYSGISHLSAVTNTTSRFKTKAAMKGYENVNVDLIQQQESKSRTICKLTELAEIALGNEDKPNSHSFSPIQSSSTPSRALTNIAAGTSKLDAVDGSMRIKGLNSPDFATYLVVDNPKDVSVQTSGKNERTKNNETRSSTSSKTIMHSSIIKAAVEEHQKAPSSKIIIPERPFKNIGLEEKESITFQKPRTSAVHLLTEDNNSMSTGSFSDRDDYDFGSLSCDEETSVRESNDKEAKDNSTESSSESSRATAKTFENKSLIMGRIFKNVSTKAATKSNAAVKKQVKSVGVQKDQTPTPKADLNQLFDELRGNSGVDVNERTVVNSGSIEGTRMPVASNRANFKQQRDVPKYLQQRNSSKASSPPAIVSSTTATPTTTARKNKPRAKPKTAAKTRKDISKLQTELGMSPDEIKKLIDDGQRKSKRRCATNRPKKLVEMWSSDEYEEFLSTKDIIALIEEKEQEEKRKKRKSSVNPPPTNSEAEKAKDTSDVTSSTKEPKRRNTKKATTELRDSLQSEKIKVQSKFIKPKKPINSKKDNIVSTTANSGGTTKKGPQKCNAKLVAMENSNVNKTKSAANSTNPKAKRAQKLQPVKARKATKTAKSKKFHNDSEDDDEDNENDDDDDDDEDFLMPGERKPKQINKTRAKTLSKTKPGNSSLSVVTSSVKDKQIPQTSKKRSCYNNSNSNAVSQPIVSELTSSERVQKQPPQKCKRKNATSQSAPRRKRTASEKLYYWSSSSDEEFGRIKRNNSNKNNAAMDNFDNSGEQYQKHGWIVGDSHKKLVTLLAIAKGTKKIDSKSSVKKNVPKKRN